MSFDHDTDSRQRTCVAVARILAADLAVSGAAINLFSKLPNGLIPIDAKVVIVTPFDPGTSLLLDIGYAARGNAAAPIAAAPAAYHNDLDLEAAAGTRTAFTALPAIVDDASGGIQLTATPTTVGAAPAVGEALVILTFAMDGVEHFTQ